MERPTRRSGAPCLSHDHIWISREEYTGGWWRDSDILFFLAQAVTQETGAATPK